MKTLTELKKQLLSETKQGNGLRIRRNEADTKDKKNAWKALIDLHDLGIKILRKKIESLEKQGLNANLSIRAIAKSVSVTGLKKSDGTLKKGYKYQVQKNGKTKIVKVVKKPIAKKKVVKKKVVKKPKKC